MKNVLRAIAVSSLAMLLAVGAAADTIYMKNGSVIRGSVVGYGNGEFTVQMASGASGSRSRAILAGDEIDHIEFGDGGGSAAAPRSMPGGRDSSPSYDPGGGGDQGSVSSEPDPDPGTADPRDLPLPRRDAPSTGPVSTPASDPSVGAGGGGGALDAGELDVRVDPRTDWTNTRFRVSRGSRIRITASGSVKLDPAGKHSSGPGGIEAPDRDKLMPSRPTGSLIAVVGDDNDDFVFVGSQAEFVADRPGFLFLSVNEGFLKDNSGSYVAHVVVEPAGSGGSVAHTGAGGLNGGHPPPAQRRTTIPAANSGASRPEPYPSDPSGSVSSAPTVPSSQPDPGAMGAATVSREGDVVVQSNLDWTNTKIRVQRGNIVRITASGNVQLHPGLRVDPAGTDAPDNDKLIPNRPTGALIAVVGDDNDDFMFIGPQSEFVAQHDGVLFLSVNEGNLKDNTGTFSAHVTILQPQVTAAGSAARPTPSSPAAHRPPPSQPSTSRSSGALPKPVVDDTLGGTAGAAAPKPIPVAIGANGGQTDIVVPAKSDWTSTAISLKKGMKVRITATGSAKLDAIGKIPTTPAGVAAPDPHKLIKDKPTGGLVAVIGDDNSDFIFVGMSAEFTAQRDGLLFLGINEGELFDNSGTYAVHIVVSPSAKH